MLVTAETSQFEMSELKVTLSLNSSCISVTWLTSQELISPYVARADDSSETHRSTAVCNAERVVKTACVSTATGNSSSRTTSRSRPGRSYGCRRVIGRPADR